MIGFGWADCMGNAYLSTYFQNNAKDTGTLRAALKAYQNTGPSKLPDLHFNRAMVSRVAIMAKITRFIRRF